MPEAAKSTPTIIVMVAVTTGPLWSIQLRAWMRRGSILRGESSVATMGSATVEVAMAV